MPLKQLYLRGGGDAYGLQVLQQIKTLEVLTLPGGRMELPEVELKAIEGLRQHPALRQIHAGGPRLNDYSDKGLPSKEEFWRQWDAEIRIMRAVLQAGSKSSYTVLFDETRHLNLEGSSFADLAILRGAETVVSEVEIENTLIVDLSPYVVPRNCA
jgi:hypothetical protein